MASYTADDWQAQLEEMLALQSIYAENFRVLHIPGQQQQPAAQHASAQADTPRCSSSGGSNSSSGIDAWEQAEQQLEALIGSEPPAASDVLQLLCCEALVSVELPAGQLQLMVDVAALNNLPTQQQQQQQQQQQPGGQQQPPAVTQGSTAGNHDQQQQQQQQQQVQQQEQELGAVHMPFGPPIKHLPPVCVQLQFPVSYPSAQDAVPTVTLHASWLGSSQQQELQQQLQELWREQGPGPVCFAWLEHVKVSALPALGVTEQLVLSGEQQQQQQQQQRQQRGAGQPGARGDAASGQAVGSSSDSAAGGGHTHKGHKQLSVEAPAFVLMTAEAAAAGAAAAGAAAAGRGSDWSSGRGRGRSSSRGGGRGRGRTWGRSNYSQQPSHQHEHQQQQQDSKQGVQAGTQLQKQQQEEDDDRQQQQQQQQQQPCAADGVSGSSSGSSAGVSVDQLAMQLLRYDAARELDDFNNSSWTCNICFTQVPGSECMRLPECHHFYCTACLSASAAATLDGGAVENMRCPEPTCRRLLPPYTVKELLGPEDFARWESMVLSRALDRMEDVVYCPRCDTVSLADTDGCAQCPKCLYAFCAECSDSWHPGSACLNLEERVRILGRRRRGTTAADRLRDLDLQNQAMNLKFIASASKACPVCGMATMKNEGCNKMSCTNCGKAWCWKCNQAITGYEHFRDNLYCVLFDQAEIDRWHAMLFANERAAQAEQLQMGVMRGRQAVGARLCRCPVCGQENLREGRNNLLRCWSCTSHFCYACRSWLRGKVGLHFVGAKACKQHGD